MKEEIIKVPKWFLENVEDTLRIQNNINLDKKTGETCQDRNIREALNGLRKMLNGEELTGMERLEKLHPEIPNPEPQGLDEAAAAAAYRKYREECGIKDPIMLDEIKEAHYADAKAWRMIKKYCETRLKDQGYMLATEILAEITTKNKQPWKSQSTPAIGTSSMS